MDYLGAMRVSCAEELARAPAQEGRRAIVDYHIDVEMAAEPWRQGTGYAYGDTRYEQLYRHTGYLKTSGGDDLKISGTGVRTHPRGPRIMSDWCGHCWETALFPSGKGFSLKRFASQDGPEGWAKPKWSEAFVFDQGRIVPAEVLESAWRSHMQPRGEDVRVRLRSTLGDAEITGQGLATSWRTMHLVNIETNYRSFGVWGEPGEYVMGQGACRWRWEGESVNGHIERSVATEMLDKSNARF